MSRISPSIAIASLVGTAAVAAGCSSSQAPLPEHLGAGQQAFDSNDSVLVDFAIDGSVLTDTAEPATVRTLIQAQLLYAVGVLNNDRSLGRYERLELSAITATPKSGSGSFAVTYHAKLPVAWGLPAMPTTYSLPLPARVGQADQAAFATKYGASCVDPSAGQIGAADAGRMFLNYRPQRAGCVLDPSDVVVSSATATVSTDTSTGKYPEYQRVWADGSLDVVALFSHSSYDAPPNDFGVRAFADFITRLDAYLAQRQPDATKRTATSTGASTVRRTALLPDGRAVHVDVALVGARLAAEAPTFDAWYDALTSRADIILYSGHADLGENVRTLMTKGTYVPGKYLLLVANACDTFAYVDRTLADRRSVLNPDDVHGTKYLDTVSTILGGYFGTGPPSAMSFLDAMVVARDATPAPKTYRQLLADLDPQQITVVTGEEDNEFAPSMFATAAPPLAHDTGSGGDDAGGATVDVPHAPPAPGQATTTTNGGSGCAVSRSAPAGGGTAVFVSAISFLLARLRRRRSTGPERAARAPAAPVGSPARTPRRAPSPSLRPHPRSSAFPRRPAGRR